MFVLCSASSTSSSTYSFGLFVTNLLCWKCWSCSPRQTLSSHEILVVLCLGRAREGKTEREPGPVTNALESWKQLAEVAKREGRDLLPFRNPHLFVQIFLSLRRIHKLSKTGDSHLQALLGFRKTLETGAGFSAQDKGTFPPHVHATSLPASMLWIWGMVHKMSSSREIGKKCT